MMGGPVGCMQSPCSVASFVRLILLVLPVSVARASDPPTEGYAPPILDSFGRLAEHMDEPGWERESQSITRSIDKLWEQNGWTTDGDRFARDVAREVASIPPWQVMKRLSTINKRLKQRYNLSDAQAAQFQGAIIGETSGVLMRNMEVITKQIREYMQIRSEGKPFTAEQVARWMREGQPIVIEMRASADRLARTLRPMLDPDKLRILDEDIKSFQKRQAFMDQSFERWARGQWRPSDWGLEDDPLHRDAPASGMPDDVPPEHAARPESKLTRPAKVAKCVAHDPETWYACVLELKEQFSLDPGQEDTAESIHAELVERGRACVQSHADLLNKVPPAERETHESYEPIRALFAEFKSRLDAIPTTGQREESKQRDQRGH